VEQSVFLQHYLFNYTNNEKQFVEGAVVMTREMAVYLEQSAEDHIELPQKQLTVEVGDPQRRT